MLDALARRTQAQAGHQLPGPVANGNSDAAVPDGDPVDLAGVSVILNVPERSRARVCVNQRVGSHIQARS